MAVVDISEVNLGVIEVLVASGERDEDPLLEKNVELEELEVMLEELVVEPFILEVASGGSTEKV